MPDSVQEQSPTATKPARMSVAEVVAKMQADRGSATEAPTPEKPVAADDGPKASTQTADAAAQDSSDGGVSDVEAADGEPDEQGADKAEAEADTKDPFLILEDEDGEERQFTEAEVKDALLLKGKFQADYTKKTQALAERQKQLDARDKEYVSRLAEADATIKGFAERGQQYDEAVQQIARLTDSAMAEFEGIDWERLEAEDPIEAARKWRRKEALKERQAALTAERDRRAGEYAQLQRANEAKAVAALHAHVQQKYPQWADDKLFRRDSEAMDRVALSLGFHADEVRRTTDARVWDLLYLAAQHEMTKTAVASTKTAAPKTNGKAPEPIRIVKPGGPRPSVRTARATEVSAMAATARKSGSFDDVLRLMRAQGQNRH